MSSHSIHLGSGWLYVVSLDTRLHVSRCTDFSKRTAKCQILLEHGDATWEANIEYFIIAGSVFEKMHPARQDSHKSFQTDNNISYESIRTLNNIKSFSDLTGKWLTMEATMPPCKPSDCQGHFQNNPALPHSFMLIPNVGRYLLLLLLPFASKTRNSLFSPFSAIVLHFQTLSGKPYRSSQE